MATAFSPLAAELASHPVLADLPAPRIEKLARACEVVAGDWTRDPQAVAILASIKANPPKREAIRTDSLAREFRGAAAIQFTGTRVRKLTAIRDRIGEAAYRLAFPAIGTGDGRAFDAWMEAGCVTDVIEAELAA